MNKIIEDQLNKSQAFKRATYNKESNSYIIKKNVTIKPVINNSYFIEIDDNIIDNNTNILAINWNKGKAPSNKYYIIDILNIISNYIYCIGIPCNEEKTKVNNKIWEGYLPLNCINIKEQIEDGTIN